jgi:hypothetical protein
MKPQSAFEREPARRVFASELRETRYQFKDGEDEKSPTYVILPSGIRSNRIFIVGTLTEKQRQGDQNIFYRGRVVDVVGKPNLYTTQDGNCLVSVRVESIAVVDRETRDLWVLDTARETLDRLDAFGTTDDSRKAQEEYGTQPDVYKKIVYDALSQVQL